MSGGQGRGRGESAKIARLEEEDPAPAASTSGPIPILEAARRSSSSGSNSDGEKTIRGRGGFRSGELNTIPAGVRETKAPSSSPGKPIKLLCNFVRCKPMSNDREIYSYRIDFEPEVESVKLRTQLFESIREEIFGGAGVIFDRQHDARSSKLLKNKVTTIVAKHPTESNTKFNVTIKNVGLLNWVSFETLRLYNMHMRKFMQTLGFFRISNAGAYVHPAFSTPVGQENSLVMVRGFRTAHQVHKEGEILMNLESVHKIMQKSNVLQLMYELKNQSSFQELIKTQLTGKLVVTNYRKEVYKVEDVDFNQNPMSTFLDDKNQKQVTFVEYFKSRHNVEIKDHKQPLLLVIQNNRRVGQREGDEQQKPIYVIPELCNIAGLTDRQRTDNRLKFQLIQSSQIDPGVRVENIMMFLKKLEGHKDIQEKLNQWGYSYDKQPVEITGRLLRQELIGVGKKAQQSPDTWDPVQPDGGFERLIVSQQLVKVPPFKKLCIIISKRDGQNENAITGELKKGFGRIGLIPEKVEFLRMDRDGAQDYTRHISMVPADATCTIVILSSQNKEKYDAVKKLASCQRGIITQVVTAKLMTDQRKASGAAVKIGIQIAAKIGGEPWHIYMPLGGAMICGYDTYHDTANRGRSFGAFVATMNPKYSRWWSKADYHDRSDELSSNMATNMTSALNKYRELNSKNPERVFLYRDGVGDGQLSDVFETEMKKIEKVVKAFDDRIRFTFIVVNKRIGARFYAKNGDNFSNPPPGTIIDNLVTRKERYDFYLVSQSTRNGVVSPTYYNIIHDDNLLCPSRHQAMAFKMCFLYYNWSGTVRVPAPCQYAHKLALLCGEHLHQVPSATLDDRLHFL